MQGYFQLFDLTPAFVLDLAQLSHSFQQLSKAKPGATNASSAQATLNAAYQTLRIPAKRAAYLLQLAGQAQHLEASIDDMQFLYEAMELREQLAEHGDNANVLQQLRQEAEQWGNALGNEFNHDYMAQNWSDARDVCRKLAFMERLANDIHLSQTQLLATPSNDDWENL